MVNRPLPQGQQGNFEKRPDQKDPGGGGERHGRLQSDTHARTHLPPLCPCVPPGLVVFSARAPRHLCAVLPPPQLPFFSPFPILNVRAVPDGWAGYSIIRRAGVTRCRNGWRGRRKAAARRQPADRLDPAVEGRGGGRRWIRSIPPPSFVLW